MTRRAAFVIAAVLSFSTLPAHAAPLVGLQYIDTFSTPAVATATRPGDSSTMWIALQNGVVRTFSGGVVQPGIALNITDHVSYGGDQGLLGITFSPGGNRFYVDYSLNQTTHIDEYLVLRGAIQPASRRQVLVFDHGGLGDHWGGAIAFGPDGYLYISTGDGGCCGDPHKTGQKLNTLLGKMLRIDPVGFPYSVPPTNPFVHTANAKPEIWAYGLRNPWRWTFDKKTNDIWLGDVGQDQWEEVDFQAASSKGGVNWGWSCWEGKHPYSGCKPADNVLPIYDYHHSVGCAVIGGYVYRGSAMPSLYGSYVFADFCAGRLIALQRSTIAASNITPVELGQSLGLPTGFGQDDAGELYVFSLYGQMYKIVP